MYDQGVQTYSAMFDGYAAATERFLRAAEEDRATESYIALFEALNWAVALDERTAKTWAPHGGPLGWGWRDGIAGAELLRGVRFARNSMQHDWAEALHLLDVDRSYPRTYPSRYREWTWRPIAEYPMKGRPDREGEAVYVAQMAGNPTRTMLVALRSVSPCCASYWSLVSVPPPQIRSQSG